MNMLATFILSFFHFFAPVPWLTDMQAARQEAGEAHKTILINFSGSDWCAPCIRLHKEIFESASFEKFASENLVLVNADFPRMKKNQLPKEQVKKNEALADKYNKQGTFPLTLLVDAQGNVLKRWEGYPDESPEKFVSEINTLVHASH